MHGGQAEDIQDRMSSKRVLIQNHAPHWRPAKSPCCAMPEGVGFGDPKQRPIAEVEQDVQAGYVSLDQASQIYGKTLAFSEQDENG